MFFKKFRAVFLKCFRNVALSFFCKTWRRFQSSFHWLCAAVSAAMMFTDKRRRAKYLRKTSCRIFSLCRIEHILICALQKKTLKRMKRSTIQLILTFLFFPSPILYARKEKKEGG